MLATQTTEIQTNSLKVNLDYTAAVETPDYAQLVSNENSQV